MNNWNGIGRLTSEPELRYTNDNRAYSRVTIAVERGISKEDKEAGKQSADFISCIFWNGNAERLCKYVKKGHRVAVEGAIRTGSYDKEDGSKAYTTDVRVNRLTFLETKGRDDRPEPEYDGYDAPTEEDPFADFGDSIEITDDDLPF